MYVHKNNFAYTTFLCLNWKAISFFAICVDFYGSDCKSPRITRAPRKWPRLGKLYSRGSSCKPTGGPGISGGASQKAGAQTP